MREIQHPTFGEIADFDYGYSLEKSCSALYQMFNQRFLKFLPSFIQITRWIWLYLDPWYSSKKFFCINRVESVSTQNSLFAMNESSNRLIPVPNTTKSSILTNHISKSQHKYLASKSQLRNRLCPAQSALTTTPSPTRLDERWRRPLNLELLQQKSTIGVCRRLQSPDGELLDTTTTT